MFIVAIILVSILNYGLGSIGSKNIYLVNYYYLIKNMKKFYLINN